MKKNEISDIVFALGIGFGGAAIIYMKFLQSATQFGARHLKKRAKGTKRFVKQKSAEFKNTHHENILKIKTELEVLAQVMEQM